MAKIYWFMVQEDNNYTAWLQSCVIEPENAFKELVNSRSKETAFIKCPAVADYYKNCFIVKSPIDISLTVREDGFVNLDSYDQEFFNYYIKPRTVAGIDKYPYMTIEFYYLFYSDDSIMVEQLPVPLDHSQLSNQIRIIPGTFNISKWIRPLTVAFEVKEVNSKIQIKRGDPLFMIRFLPEDNSKVVLERVMPNKETQNIMESCVNMKHFVPRNTLQQNYDAIKGVLFAWRKKRKVKNSKCPFHFWK